MSCCSEEYTLKEKIVEKLQDFRGRDRSDSYLIPALQIVQEEYGYLSRQHLDEVARLLSVPYARVTGVASFYQFFNFQPAGEYEIIICTGTACHVRGAGAVFDRFLEELGVEPEEPTEDGKFSVTDARCVGACSKAPVVIIEEKVYSHVAPDDVPDILADFGYSP